MKKTLIAAALAVGFASSAFAGNATIGSIYTGTSETVAQPVATIQTSPKKVSGSNTAILMLVSLGDSSAETLAKKAGITKIHKIEKNNFSIGYFIPFFWQETFTVYGE